MKRPTAVCCAESRWPQKSIDFPIGSRAASALHRAGTRAARASSRVLGQCQCHRHTEAHSHASRRQRSSRAPATARPWAACFGWANGMPSKTPIRQSSPKPANLGPAHFMGGFMEAQLERGAFQGRGGPWGRCCWAKHAPKHAPRSGSSSAVTFLILFLGLLIFSCACWCCCRCGPQRRHPRQTPRTPTQRSITLAPAQAFAVVAHFSAVGGAHMSHMGHATSARGGLAAQSCAFDDNDEPGTSVFWWWPTQDPRN